MICIFLIEEDSFMTQDTFKQLIEAPVEGKNEFLEKVCTRGVIQRSVRIALQYPEMAQEYLDNLPKSVNEDIPTPSMAKRARFKIGDKIISISNRRRIFEIIDLTDTHYSVIEQRDGLCYLADIEEDVNWELAAISNKKLN
jgi:hypothetical protein